MRRILICVLMVLAFAACGSKEERRDGFFANGLKAEAEGRIPEARIEAKNVIKLDPNHVGAYLLLGRCALKEQNWREAFGSYQRAVDRFKPYDRLQAPIPGMRRDVVRLARRAIERNVPAFVLVNNRAEGNAPLTVDALGRMLVSRSAG